MNNEESQPIIKDKVLYAKSMVKATAASLVMTDSMASIMDSSGARGAIGIVEMIAGIALVVSSMEDAGNA